MLTIGLIGVVSAIAVVQVGSAHLAIRGDGGMRIVMAQMNTARETSISERRNVQVVFPGQNTVQLVRQDIPTGTTLVGSAIFEGGVQLDLEPGLPDTPDGFGHAQAVDFGAATRVMFSSDGTLVDQAGNPVNGTIFVAVPGQPRSQRAITILGSIGRVRGYRWDGQEWVRV